MFLIITPAPHSPVSFLETFVYFVSVDLYSLSSLVKTLLTEDSEIYNKFCVSGEEAS